MRALSCLAGTTESGAVLGRDLAELAEVPANYLTKILLVLNRAGFVEATRGTGGGYRLARPPGEISLMQIVELFDPQAALYGCLLDASQQCSEATPCPAHERWSEVRDTYMNFLETTTLEQISDRRREEDVDGRPST